MVAFGAVAAAAAAADAVVWPVAGAVAAVGLVAVVEFAEPVVVEPVAGVIAEPVAASAPRGSSEPSHPF